MKKYDLLIIGGGSGGVATANRAASYGAKVALFEEKKNGRYMRKCRMCSEKNYVGGSKSKTFSGGFY